jgi:hypothetical protein
MDAEGAAQLRLRKGRLAAGPVVARLREEAPGEIADADRGHDRDREVEVAQEPGRERGQVAAQREPDQAHRGAALLAQEMDQLADLVDRLAHGLGEARDMRHREVFPEKRAPGGVRSP